MTARDRYRARLRAERWSNALANTIVAFGLGCIGYVFCLSVFLSQTWTHVPPIAHHVEASLPACDLEHFDITHSCQFHR